MIQSAMICPRCRLGILSGDDHRCEQCGFSLGARLGRAYPWPEPSVPVEQPGVDDAPAGETLPAPIPEPDLPAELHPLPRVLVSDAQRCFPIVRVTLGAAAVLSVVALLEWSPPVDPPAPVRPAAVVVPSASPSAGESNVAPADPPSAPAPVPEGGTAAPEPAPAAPELDTPPTSSPPPEPIAAPAPPLAPGRLFVNSTPWGQLFVDGTLVGNTPRANLPLDPGPHLIRVVRYGFEPFERELVVAPGETIRLTNIVLQERP